MSFKTKLLIVLISGIISIITSLIIDIIKIRIKKSRDRKEAIDIAQKKVVFFCNFLISSISNLPQFECPDNILNFYIKEYVNIKSSNSKLHDDYEKLINIFICLKSNGYILSNNNLDIKKIKKHTNIIEAIIKRYEDLTLSVPKSY